MSRSIPRWPHEVLVHLGLGGLADTPLEHHSAAVDIPDGLGITRVPHVPNEPLRVGEDWLQSGSSLLLRVPSVVIPEAYNFILNPLHPDMKQVEVEDLGLFVFDARVR